MDDFDLLDHYSVLGVDRDAPPGEIDRAYREALLREHPDRSNHPHANERASRVNEAGRVLLDPNRRRQYDPEADTRERSARAGLRHLPVAAAEDNGSSQGSSDPRSRAGTDADEERYAQVAHNPRQQRGIDKPAAHSSRVWRTFIAGTAAIAALIVTAALIYQFVLRAETADFGQPGRANNEATVSAVADDQPAPSPTDQSAKASESNVDGQHTRAAGQAAESDSASQSRSSSEPSRSNETNPPEATSAPTSGSDEGDVDSDSDARPPTSTASNRGVVSPSSPYCQANPDDEDCRDDGEMQAEDGQSSDSGNGLSRQAATSGAQFAGKHGGPLNLEMGRSMPQLDASLTNREREIQLGPWFYRQLFQFSDEIVRHDGRLGLIGYNYYSSDDFPSSVCRDSNGEPFSHGWDAQPYGATPAGRQGVSDWQTRSWHAVYSVLHGEVVFVDPYSGDLGIFDGENTVYYKHLNEIGGNFHVMASGDGTTGRVEVFPGDYLGRMGMRGTALAPHLTLEVRAGLPPHDRCPTEGSATSPIPYLYRLLGGR